MQHCAEDPVVYSANEPSQLGDFSCKYPKGEKKQHRQYLFRGDGEGKGTPRRDETTPPRCRSRSGRSRQLSLRVPHALFMVAPRGPVMNISLSQQSEPSITATLTAATAVTHSLWMLPPLRVFSFCLCVCFLEKSVSMQCVCVCCCFFCCRWRLNVEKVSSSLIYFNLQHFCKTFICLISLDSVTHSDLIFLDLIFFMTYLHHHIFKK